MSDCNALLAAMTSDTAFYASVLYLVVFGCWLVFWYRTHA